jgi:selenide,water dikinase
MSRLNTAGSAVAELGLAKAAIDVTGFGLIGHLAAMCRASGVGAEIDAPRVPAVGREVFDLVAQGCIPGGSRDNLTYAAEFTDWNGASVAQQTLLTDAQTSGGLLFAVSPKHVESVLKLLRTLRTPSAALVGRIVRSRAARIRILA